MPAPLPPDRSRYVQYGSGPTGPASWRNFDASPTLRLQRLPVVGALVRQRLPAGRDLFEPTVEFGDIVAGLPVPEGHCRAVYCAHVLEHLTRDECLTALANTYTYLAPGGVFRLVMPDLHALAASYLAATDADAAHRFMARSYLGQAQRPGSLMARTVHTFSNAMHRWMWDYPALHAALHGQGFVSIRRAAFGDFDEPRFADVEVPSRWEEPALDGAGTIPCLGVECRRPER